MHTESKHGERDALSGCCLCFVGKAVAVGLAYVEVAIRAEDYAVVTPFDKMLASGCVSKLDACASVSRAAGF